MNLPGRDWIVINAGILLIAGCLLQLYREYSSRSDSSTVHVGDLTYRYRVAQLRHSSTVVWENIDPGDRVFSNDAVRTDELSEAILTLKDGTKIEMDPDSMIVLNLSEGKQELDFKTGSIVIHPGSGSDWTIRQGDRELSSMEDRTRITLQGSDLEIESASGAELLEGGSKSQIPGGKTARLRGGRFEFLESSVVLESPEDNSRFFMAAESMPVQFAWKSESASRFQLSLYRDFSHILDDREAALSPATALLPEGIYYWRVLNATTASVTRKFRIIRTLKPDLYTPSDAQEIMTDHAEENVFFSWQTVRLASSYRIQIARDAEFRNVTLDTELRRTNISLPVAPGQYFWKVTAQGGVDGSLSASPVRRFSLTKISGPTENRRPAENPAQSGSTRQTEARTELPSPIYPAPGSVVDMSKLNALPLQWSAVDGASEYSIRVWRTDGTPVFETSTAQTSAAVTDLSRLDTGSFRWSIDAKIPGKSAAHAEGDFTITLSEELEKPQLNIHETP